MQLILITIYQYFPFCSVPALHIFFPIESVIHQLELFKVNQLFKQMLSDEVCTLTHLVLSQSSFKIIGAAGIVLSVCTKVTCACILSRYFTNQKE